jgi:23S rRNA pseudouridine1911/1915/1917 synthase
LKAIKAEDFEGAKGEKLSSCPANSLLSFPDLMLTVHESDAKQRLDVFVSHHLRDCSRNAFQTLIKAGQIQVNGLSVKPSYEVRTGDRIAVHLPRREDQGALRPQSLPLEILYEDEDIIVLNKAPGIVVHPGAGHYEGTLVHGLLAKWPRLASQGAPLRPGIVHRLDQHTSGALVVAKTDAAYLNLSHQFQEHTVEKHYLALVYGAFSQTGGKLVTMLGRHPTDRKKIAVLHGKGREAITRWQVIRVWEEVTLLRVSIETGRTHQIRVHLSHLGHPVVGDVTYGGGKRKARQIKSEELQDVLGRVDRQLLHAEVLSFRHPRTNAPVAFTAPLAEDFSIVLKQLEANFSVKRP